MTAWYFVTLLAMGPAATIAQAVTDWPFPAYAWPSFLVFVVGAVMSHRGYAKARSALAADPSLRGGWLVRHLWWGGLAALFAANVLVALVVYGWPFR